MKFLHVADTHLGYSAYRKITETGINQRELDNYQAFKQFIDYALKIKPDFILHAGDLFDSVRPNNRAITNAIKQINRISKEKIPIIIIAGNHEQPKLKETGHIFSIFNHLENVYPIYKSKYEKINLTIKSEKITIHAVPQCEIKEHYNEELEEIIQDNQADFNILLAHGSVIGIKEFLMNEFNELIIPGKILRKNFNYVALGHYHKYTKIRDNAFYSGSIEKFTFTDALDKKGFIAIELKKDYLDHKFIQLTNSTMIDSKPIKCSNMRINEIMNNIKKTITKYDPKEKTIRLTLNDIPSKIYRELDFKELRNICSNATHFEIKVNIKKRED